MCKEVETRARESYKINGLFRAKISLVKWIVLSIARCTMQRVFGILLTKKKLQIKKKIMKY